jgi:SAM-dependent methyltransferase
MSSKNLISPNYDPFAWIYNETWGPTSCKRELPRFEKWLLQNLPMGAKILDLCCGTGQVVQQLLSKGYQVTGLDSSEGMLYYARQNAPDGQFILADARFFELPPTYDAIISTNVGLNHIMSFEELKSTFQNVYAALLENGSFMFDIKMEGQYQSLDSNNVIIDGDVKDKYAWACRQKYNPEDKTSQFEMTIFHLAQENWQRSDLTWPLKVYSREEVKSILKNVGFKDIVIYDDEGNLASDEYNSDAYFLCHK